MLCVFQYTHPNLEPFLPFSKKLLFSLILFLLQHTGVIGNSYPLCKSVCRSRKARSLLYTRVDICAAHISSSIS